MNRDAVLGWTRQHPLLCDAIFGLFAMSLTVSAALYSPKSDFHRLTPSALVVAVVCAVVVTFRRRWPIPVLLALAVLTLASPGFSLPAGFTGGAILLAAATVGVRCRPTVSLALCAALSVVFLIGSLIAQGIGGLQAENLNLVILTLLAAVGGIAIRDRRAYLAALLDRADRAERTRETEAARRVAEERLRIARDLHDSLAHHMAVVGVQTGVAAHLLHTDPEAAGHALVHARTAAGQVLDELGTVLGVLRNQGEGEPTEPAPSLARLGGLIDPLRAAGLDVRSTVVGRPRAVPPAVDQAAYRLVQEALTNVQKHAPGSRVRLTIDYREHALDLEIVNNAAEILSSPTDPESAGFGLTGMRERCAAVGGRLETGPVVGGGFRVFASLPAVAGEKSLHPASPADAAPRGTGPARIHPMSDTVPRIRVLIADDQALIRGGFRAIIGSDPEMEVVGEADDGRKAVALTRLLHPDVVVMDIRMPELDGIGATGIICADESCSSTRVLILTTFELDEHVAGALRAGASGFLGKSVAPTELLDGIRMVAKGESLLSPAATRSLISRFLASPQRSGSDPERLAALTVREREVVALVAAGLSNEEIAARLVLSPLTAKTHVNRSMLKLGVRDRAALVVLAYQSGLVSSSPNAERAGEP